MKYDVESATLTLHQSDLNHFMKCPEQFRVVKGLLPNVNMQPGEARVETDAATLGTTLHSVIEADLDEPFTSVGEAITHGRLLLFNLMGEYIEAGVEYRTESFGPDPQKILSELDILVEAWYLSRDRRTLMAMKDRGDLVQVEWNFDVPFIQGREGIIQNVNLAGTADILLPDEMWDWKSAGRAYQRWEYQRWAIQPTVYTYAAAASGLLLPDSEGRYKFVFKVFMRGKIDAPQTVEVFRTEAQWGWLLRLVENVCRMWESDADEWPLRDDHALCGPKWCPVWSTCKGAFVNEDWS